MNAPLQRKDLAGQRFGRLVAVAYSHSAGSIGHLKAYWKCLCDCGGEKTARSDSLQSLAIQSCGCLHKESARNAAASCITHGKRQAKIYGVWTQMIQRCTNQRNHAYADYGGRGITVCERWRTFDGFYADMGDAPPGMTLDRFPNNDGNYEPSNCRWATRKDQATNRRPHKKHKPKPACELGVFFTAEQG